MTKTNQTSPQTITDDKIAERAYQLWQQRGCPEGDGSQDWDAAKEQLVAEVEHSGHRIQPFRNLLARLRNRAASM